MQHLEAVHVMLLYGMRTAAIPCLLAGDGHLPTSQAFLGKFGVCHVHCCMPIYGLPGYSNSNTASIASIAIQ